jgi:hypothetical protein
MKGFYPTIVDDILHATTTHKIKYVTNSHNLKMQTNWKIQHDAFEGDHTPSIIGFYPKLKFKVTYKPQNHTSLIKTIK